MTASPSRGLLYPTPPEYDVFKPRSETTDESEDARTDVADAPAEREGTATPTTTRANWTGTVPADD